MVANGIYRCILEGIDNNSYFVDRCRHRRYGKDRWSTRPRRWNTRLPSILARRCNNNRQAAARRDNKRSNKPHTYITRTSRLNHAKRLAKSCLTHVIVTSGSLLARQVAAGDRFLALGPRPKPRALTHNTETRLETTASVVTSRAPIRGGRQARGS